MANDDVLLAYTDKHPDGTVESVTVRRTEDEAYTCGWKYRLHFGTTDGETLLRYDNAHEPTKGHERHVGDRIERIDFPGMDALLAQFHREVDDRQQER